MVAALMLDFYGTVVHEDDAVITAICAQVASTLTAPVPPGDIARRWSGWFADECASSAGQAFKSQRDAVRASLVRLLDALGSPEDPDQLTLAQLFERGLDLLGVRRDAVLHAGDSLSSDVAGANSAGIPVAWVNRSARPRPPGVSLWAEVADLAELAELLTTR